MKKYIQTFGLFFVIACSCVLFSCSDYLYEAATFANNSQNELSDSDWKGIFASNYTAQTKTRSADCFGEGPILAPGFISPQWQSLSSHYGSSDAYVTASMPFECLYGYRVFYPYSDDCAMRQISSELILYQHLKTGETMAWLFFMFPDPIAVQDEKFSGIALYTSLKGIPLAAGKFQNGNLLGSAAWNNDPEWGGDASDLARLLDGLFVARIENQPTTRGVNDNNEIEVVVIIGELPPEIPEPDFPEEGTCPPSPFEDMFFRMKIGGGGSGSEGKQDTNTSKDSYDKNPKIKVDDRSRQILDSLVQTCIGELMVNSVKANTSISYNPSNNGSKASYHPSNGSFTITIGNGYSTIGVLEELIHIYQGLGSNEDYIDNKLNYEIEAKLIWSMFYIGYDDMRLRPDVYGGQSGLLSFQILYEHVATNMMDSIIFNIYYDLAAKSLQQIKGYKSYLYNSALIISNTLKKILEHCDPLPYVPIN